MFYILNPYIANYSVDDTLYDVGTVSAYVFMRCPFLNIDISYAQT